MILLKYVNILVSGSLLAWGVLIKLDYYSKREAEGLYKKWKQKTR